MVTIIPGYMYSIIAALVVGTILVSTCSLAMVNLRNESASQQLRNIDEYVATQSLNLINQAAENDQNITEFLNMPSNIGNREYWICIGNDSSGAWVESGFGATAILGQSQLRIPVNVAASGTFVSGWGRPLLQCYWVNQTVCLTLTGDY